MLRDIEVEQLAKQAHDVIDSAHKAVDKCVSDQKDLEQDVNDCQQEIENECGILDPNKINPWSPPPRYDGESNGTI